MFNKKIRPNYKRLGAFLFKASFVVMAGLMLWLFSFCLPNTRSSLSGPTQKLIISPELTAAGLSVFVSGIGTEKITDSEYRVEVGTQVAIASVNESACFSAWNLIGASPTSAGNSYTTIAAMPPNDVTVGASSKPATAGTSFATAFILDEFDDFFALQEIIANTAVPAGQDALFAEYIARFSLSGTYAAARQALQIGHFKVSSTVSLTQPKPAGASADWQPDRFFTGIGRTNVAATSFQGVIDGGNQAIVLNVNISEQGLSSNRYIGLFGALPAYSAGTVNGSPKPAIVLRNLHVIGNLHSSISFNAINMSSYIGGIAGLLGSNICMSGCVSGVYASAKATFPGASTSRCLYLGGLVGHMSAPVAHGSGNRYSARNMILSGESNSAVYSGGCFGMSTSAYILDASSDLSDCQVNALSENTTAAISSSHAGGIVGHYNASGRLMNCNVSADNHMVINATTDGTSTAYTASVGGIAGLITGTPELSNNNINANSDNKDSPDAVSGATIRGRDLMPSTVATIYSGGLYGRFATAGVRFSAPFGSLNTNDSHDMFGGNVSPSTLLSGNATSYTGGIVGYGSFLTTDPAGLSFNISGVRVRTVQKNTTSKYTNPSTKIDDPTVGTSYTGGLCGGMQSGIALSDVTLYGSGAIIEEIREPGASNNISPIYVGGIMGYKSGGSISNCKLLLSDSALSLSQNSYLSAAGNIHLGGIVGMAEASCTLTDCLVAGSFESGAYSGSTLSITGIINTIAAAHGTADGYVGGIVGKANSSAHMLRCRYIGSSESENDYIKLISNNSSNSPSIGGIVGFAVASKTTDCHVSNAYIYGEGYNGEVLKTDTDMIVGGICGLINGAGSVENCMVSDCAIESYGRDYTLTYAGGITGSQYGSTAIIRGCVSENNDIIANAQKKWAAGAGIVGYQYDGTMTIDNCLAVGNSIYVSAANVEAGQYTEAIGGGILGRVNHDSNYTTRITNCFSNTEVFATHIKDDKIVLGGLIGFRINTTNLNCTGSFFHVQNFGLNRSVGYCPETAALINLDKASALDFRTRLLDDSHPQRILFPSGLTASNSAIITDGGNQPQTITFQTDLTTIEGQSVQNQYVAGRQPGMSGEGHSNLNVSITQFVPGSAYPAGTAQGAASRYFGTVSFQVISGQAPAVSKVTLIEDSEQGREVSTENENTSLSLTVDRNSQSDAKAYYAISDPMFSTENGMKSLTSFQYFIVNNTEYIPAVPSLLTQCGVTITEEGNRVGIKPNVAIDSPRSFAIRAVDSISGTVISETVLITVNPVFIQEVRLDSVISPEKVGFGSIKDAQTPLGSVANPLIIVKNSTLKLAAKAYGEGSSNIWQTGEIYITPTNQGALFESAEYISGTDGALSVHADGTVFTAAGTGGIDSDTLYRTRIKAVGKNRDGETVYSQFYYIKIIEPLKVNKLTSGSIPKECMIIPTGNETPGSSYVISGANIDGGNSSFLQWNADYVFTTNPQTSYGGVVEAYYVFGEPSPENPFRKIEIGEPNDHAYGTLTSNPSGNWFEFRIKANPDATGALTVTAKYFATSTSVFYPQNGDEPLVMVLPVGKPLGKIAMDKLMRTNRPGYELKGWYGIDNSAESEAAYGAALTADTVILGGNLYYARWVSKVAVSDTPGLRVSSLTQLNDTQNLTFQIIKKESFFGAPPVDISIYGEQNPVPIPPEYDGSAEITHKEMIDGSDTVCVQLAISKNDNRETVYSYTFSSRYLAKCLYNSDGTSDVISIRTDNSSASFAIGEARDLESKAILIQDSVFTLRYTVNHGSAVGNSPSSYAYKPDNGAKAKKLALSFISSAGEPQVLPVGTTVRLHYMTIDQSSGKTQRSVFQYVLSSDSSEFDSASFVAIGGTNQFPLRTFSDFTASSEFIPEEYCFVVTVPYQSEALAAHEDIICVMGFLDGTEIADETELRLSAAVEQKRSVALSIESSEIEIGETRDFSLNISFLNELDEALSGIENRDNHFGIALSFFDLEGKTIWLPEGSTIAFNNPERTLRMTAAAPLQSFYFATGAGEGVLSISLPSEAPSNEFDMRVRLLSSSEDNLYGCANLLQSNTIRVISGS